MNDWMLAQQATSHAERFKYMQDRFNQSDPTIGWKLLLVAVILGAIFALASILSRLQKRRDEPNKPQPMALFVRVQRKLGLPRLDRLRLWWLVRTRRINNPAALLISAQYFDDAVEGYCQSDGWFGSRLTASSGFAAIRQQLFGSDCS